VSFLSRQKKKKLFHVHSHPRTLFYNSEDSDAHYNDFQYWKDSLSNVDEKDVRSVTGPGDSGERRQRRRRKRPATKRRPVRPPVFGLTSEEEEEGERDEKRDEMEEEVGFSGSRVPDRKEEGVPEKEEEDKKRDEMEEEMGFSGPQDGPDRKKEGESEQEVSKQSPYF
jgi:hypothetical protein